MEPIAAPKVKASQTFTAYTMSSSAAVKTQLPAQHQPFQPLPGCGPAKVTLTPVLSSVKVKSQVSKAGKVFFAYL